MRILKALLTIFQSYSTTLHQYVCPFNVQILLADCPQVGQIPILDLLFLKNPLYLLLSKWGFIDSTFPVAKFAQNRMAERYPKTADGSVLPTEEKVAMKPDLLSKFIQAKADRPDFMNDSLVMTMAVSMAFAGSETTAISLAAVFYYLLKNPASLQKLLAEIDDKARANGFKDNKHGLVEWSEAQEMPYLDACVKEAFRLHPAPGLPLERIVPEQGVEIAGKFVKGGTIVGVSAWVIHRNKEIFGEDVEAFRPERWMVDPSLDKASEEKRIKEMASTLLHFGMGARTCIGKNISLMEMYKLVPTVFRRFEVCAPWMLSCWVREKC